MATYSTQYRNPLSKITAEERLSNQVVLSGTDDTYPISNGIFFLVLLETTGTVDIKDGDGNTICTGISGFSNDHDPLRCDKGIEIVGTAPIAKGFYVKDALVI